MSDTDLTCGESETIKLLKAELYNMHSDMEDLKDDLNLYIEKDEWAHARIKDLETYIISIVGAIMP